MDDRQVKHLEFIQGVINRMAGNLFLLKGWTITLIAALFALAAKDAKPGYALLAYIPIFVFWCLDGYFLGQERQFRDLYNQVRLKKDDFNFSLDTSEYAKKRDRKWYGAMMSGTLAGYYGPLVIITFIVMMWVGNAGKCS